MNHEQICMDLAGVINHPGLNQDRITAILGAPEWCVYQFTVAGVSFRQHELAQFQNGNWATVKVELKPEPTNRYDPNAIEVIFTDRANPAPTHVGYVPKALTTVIGPAANHSHAWARLESVGTAKQTKDSSQHLGAIIQVVLRFDPMAQPALVPHRTELLEFAR